MLVALDFDGTLAPIAGHPAEVVFPAASREALERLAARPDTDVAVVSGRSLEDTRARVGLPGLYYAGNHGMEIEGPGIQEVHSGAAAARSRIAACAASVREWADRMEGVVLEDKGLTLSVHYRLVRDPAVAEEVQRRVRERCGAEPGLRITGGKQVIEVRPDVPWDKGRAVRFLLDALEAPGTALLPAIFIGDDATDEDAFRALRGRGDGVVVASPAPAETAATAWVASVAEVAALLNALAAPG